MRLLLLCLLLLNSCAPKTITVTEFKEVKVPVKCQVAWPDRPTRQSPVALWVSDLVSYTLQLEAALKACTDK